VNHNHEHENIANKNFIQFIKDEAKNTKQNFDTVVKRILNQTGNTNYLFTQHTNTQEIILLNFAMKMRNMEG
jgi:hypothetical protein